MTTNRTIRTGFYQEEVSYTELQLERIKIHARVVLSFLCPSPSTNIYRHSNPLVLLLAKFVNGGPYLIKSPKTLEEENHDLNQLMLKLPEFKNIPIINLFHQLCLIETQENANPENKSIFRLDETFLRNAKKYTDHLCWHFIIHYRSFP